MKRTSENKCVIVFNKLPISKFFGFFVIAVLIIVLVDAIKSGATNEEIYELVRSIYGEAMKKTYYSLLKRDKYYQSLLTKTDEAEKKLNQQEMSVETRNAVDHFIDLSTEIDDESHAVLYLAAFIDSYHFFKALGLVIC